MTAGYYSTLDRIAVLFIDLNGLKKINDTHGHAQGDKAINIVAGCISGITSDTSRRYRSESRHSNRHNGRRDRSYTRLNG